MLMSGQCQRSFTELQSLFIVYIDDQGLKKKRLILSLSLNEVGKSSLVSLCLDIKKERNMNVVIIVYSNQISSNDAIYLYQ